MPVAGISVTSLISPSAATFFLRRGAFRNIPPRYGDFTVGGSVSVNCHGRYVGRGPVVNSVRAVQLVTHDGQVLELTRTRDSELFGAVFGGYGGLGVITEVELNLDDNVRINWVVELNTLDCYPEFFRNRLGGDPNVILDNADLLPPNFDTPVSVSWMRTARPVTIEDRLVPRGLSYTTEKNTIFAITELPGGGQSREFISVRASKYQRAYPEARAFASLKTRIDPKRRFTNSLWNEYLL